MAKCVCCRDKKWYEPMRETGVYAHVNVKQQEQHLKGTTSERRMTTSVSKQDPNICV